MLLVTLWPDRPPTIQIEHTKLVWINEFEIEMVGEAIYIDPKHWNNTPRNFYPVTFASGRKRMISGIDRWLESYHPDGDRVQYGPGAANSDQEGEA